MKKIAIIGGSGLEDPEILKDIERIEVDTPYGKPSSDFICGNIGGVDVVILSRHDNMFECYYSILLICFIVQKGIILSQSGPFFGIIGQRKP